MVYIRHKLRIMTDAPIRRFTLLLLHQAQNDRATEVVLGPPHQGTIPIRYRVEGKSYDVSPPPAQIVPDVLAEIARLTGSPDGVYPMDGNIDVDFSGARLRWRVRMEAADGKCVLTPIS